MSPVCSTSPAGVRIATASASGIEWLTAKYSQSHGPCRSRAPSATSSRCGVSRCSLHLAATSASVNRDPTTVQVRPLAQQERHRTDVVLVAVGEHQRVDVVEPLLDRPEVRAGSGRRPASPRSGTAPRSRRRAAGRRARTRSCCGRSRRCPRGRRLCRPPAGRGGGGPVGSSAGLASSGCAGWCGPGRAGAGGDADRRASGPTGRAVASRCRDSRRHSGTAVRDRPGPPPPRGRARAGRRPPPGRPAIAATCSGVAGGSGSRGSPTSDAAQPQRRLAEDRLRRCGPSRGSPGTSRRAARGRGAMSPASYASTSTRSRSATTCPMTLTKPTAPIDSHGRFSGSSPQ